ncbi:MAG: GHKL domain-containing protein [Calditrichaeota bacterium]|nr:MAG: GHKL domain-containing protein [Calditrichota bacterium]
MKKSRLFKIIIAFFLAILLPVLSVTIFEVIQQDKKEALLESIYERQLDTILFAVNQNCWDNFNSWVTELSSQFSKEKNALTQPQKIKSKLKNFVRSYSPIHSGFIRTGLSTYTTYIQGGKDQIPDAALDESSLKEIEGVIMEDRIAILKMADRARQGYVNPHVLRWPQEGDTQTTLLLFPLVNIENAKTIPTLAGIFIDDLTFIREIVGRKFNSMQESSFIFGVRDVATAKIIYTTEEVNSDIFERSEAMWIIPSLQLEIKLAGTTLEEFSQSQTQSNFLVLTIINFILLVSIFYIIRYVYLEMLLAQKEKDFVANVSHELRTPLALIRMFAELMEMGRVRSEEKKQHYYRTIMAESTRLTQLINNILDFSKIESKRKTYNLKPSNIRLIVNDIMDFYQYHIQQKGFKINSSLELNLPLVQLDSEAVRQAVVNLIDNAIKYSNGNKSIHITLKRMNGTVVLSVQDFGLGIPVKEQKKIFKKFYRVENSLIHTTKGSGLGLTLVKNIMVQHKGQITVKSKVGEGSTFSLVFPVMDKNGEIDGSNSDR